MIEMNDTGKRLMSSTGGGEKQFRCDSGFLPTMNIEVDPLMRQRQQ